METVTDAAPCIDIGEEIEATVMHHVRAVAKIGEELCALETGWDNAEAPRIDREAVRNAVHLVAKVTCAECLTPTVSPTTTGKVLLDWTWGPDHVEVEVGAGLVAEVLAEVTGDLEWEGELRLDDTLTLHRLAHYITAVGLQRFTEE